MSERPAMQGCGHKVEPLLADCHGERISASLNHTRASMLSPLHREPPIKSIQRPDWSHAFNKGVRSADRLVAAGTRRWWWELWL